MGSSVISWMKMGPEIQNAIGMKDMSVKSIRLNIEIGKPVTAQVEVFIREDDVAGVVDVVKRAEWVGDEDIIDDVTSVGDGEPGISKFEVHTCDKDGHITTRPMI